MRGTCFWGAPAKLVHVDADVFKPQALERRVAVVNGIIVALRSGGEGLGHHDTPATKLALAAAARAADLRRHNQGRRAGVQLPTGCHRRCARQAPRPELGKPRCHGG